MERSETLVTYLIQRGYLPKTARRYGKLINMYFKWCDENGFNPDTTSLDKLYQYKNWFVERGYKDNTIRQHIAGVKHYFNSIGREENPALLVKHRKRESTLPSAIFNEEELKEFYKTLRAQNIVQKRNKVMLGMVIFQGMKREELDAIEISHVDLENASVYVSASHRTYSRTVELHPLQVGLLSTYLYEVRPRLQIEANKKETDRLFFSMGEGKSVQNGLQIQLNQLKREHSEFRSLTQIKESRMMIWVKQHGIRKAQYLSGIKYTSSMLRYKTNDVDRLKQKLAIVHPMERLKL